MSKKKSNFSGKVGADAHRQQSSGSSYGHLQLPRGVNVFSVDGAGGRVFLDILPYEVTDPKHPDFNKDLDIASVGSLWYKRPYKLHRNVGASNDTAVCPTSIGKKCPICEYRAKRIKEQADKEETDAMKPSLRNLYVVVPIGDKKHEEKPSIFDISQFLFQNLLNEELSENPEYEIFPDIEEGYTLKIRFESKTIGKSQPFAEADRIDFIDRENPYTDTILKQVPNLDQVLIIMSYDELNAKFFELENEEDAGRLKSKSDDEEEDKPARRRREEPEEKPIRRVREEEPEEKPARRAAPAAKSRDEEEDKPTRRAAPVSRKEEPEEKPAASTRQRPSKTENNRCPEGYKFGIDTEKYDKCDTCDAWPDCADERDRLNEK